VVLSHSLHLICNRCWRSEYFRDGVLSLIVPIVGEMEWLALFDDLPRWTPSESTIVIVAPHPDDETLAVGGFISSARREAKRIIVVAVTDGEHAYDDEPDLGKIRRVEQEKALAALDVSPRDIVRLGLRDREVGAQEGLLIEALIKLTSSGALILAPWPGDFHPDHEASGRAAREAARISGAKLAYYFFWTWHRGSPESISSLPLHVFPLAPEFLAAKLKGLQCHVSQLSRSSGDPVLPESLLGPTRRNFEVILPA
jgi:LmbE family N-acetylglucosaminyl deacetylase